MTRRFPRVPLRTPGRAVPLRHSLIVKLLLLSAVVSCCSIAATTWLTVHSTAVAIRQQQGQALAGSTEIYDALLGYAATHPDWTGSGELVRKLSQRTGLPIVITDEHRRILQRSERSEGGFGEAPAAAYPPTASVDPLDVDAALTGLAPGPATVSACAVGQPCAPGRTGPPPDASGIDPRAVGPYLLPANERAQLRTRALRIRQCLGDTLGIAPSVKQTPSGRSYLETPATGFDVPGYCGAAGLGSPTPTEANALHQLDTLVMNCLAGSGVASVRVTPDMRWTYKGSRAADTSRIAPCLAEARREQLSPYVAPAVLLFVGDPQRTATTFFDLSPANRTRISLVAGLVLVVTLTATLTMGGRLVRPLRALAGAARRMSDGDLSTRVTLRADNEIGHVATAFNTMSEKRERAENLRKEMVNDIAHELRNPLSNIRGWLEAAQDGLAAPDPALLSALHTEAMALQYIIDDLRDLAAADAGELRVRSEAVAVPELLAQVVEAHRSAADAVEVALVAVTEGPLRIAGDPVRLRQMVGNLVSNGVRHTPPGGRVTLRGDAEGDWIVIRVCDNGTGIPAEDLPRIFDRFWRGEKSRNRKHGGSGLGLAIVRNLTELHGGTIAATSAPGEGATFTLRLPAFSGRNKD